MTITERLEGLLPADGPMTKTDRIIAEAVGELRTAWADIELIGNDADMAWNRVGILQDRINRMGDRNQVAGAEAV